MTVPASAAVSVAALVDYRKWEQLTNDLAVQSARLAAAVEQGRWQEARQLVSSVDFLVKAASDAAGRYVSYRIPVAPEVMERWKSVLRRSQDALQESRRIPAELPVMADGQSVSGAMIDAGFRIPGTSIVVPWVAVVGVLVVVGVGFYVSRRRR